MATSAPQAQQPAVLRGTLLALGAAVTFGITAPWIARAGAGLGACTIGSALYAGAAGAALLLRVLVPPQGPPLTLRQVPRLAFVAAFGALLAPIAYVWGIQRAGPATASLLVNLEAPFTSVLAVLFLGEPLGRRVLGALLAMLAGGSMLVLDLGGRLAWSLAACSAVALAAAAWAVDNTLSRTLADHDPVAVVGAKGVLGAATAALLALALGESAPAPAQLGALLLCGATGYGASLRLYLLAQRCFGALRTASVFAVAPFVGAAVAWALGDRGAGVLAGLGAACFVVGVVLHATERHDHEHVHEALEYEHEHAHDDGHHDHAHDPPVSGVHTHRHVHVRVVHRHAHVPDLHHDHHGRGARS